MLRIYQKRKPVTSLRYVIPILLLYVQFTGPLDAQVQINIDRNVTGHRINPMVQGMGIIYSFEADSLYDDGRLAQLYKDVGLGFLRWPGGAVTTFYHWNDLNGMGWMDNWKPGYNHDNDQDPENYMDLDEYIDLCRVSDTEPMLGINMSSGMEWNREADALNEAVSLVKYCIDQDFEVNYIYLDNETYHIGNSFNADPDGDEEGWTAALYGEKINLYADSIRKYLPNVKLIPNWKRNIRTGNASMKTLINTAGENIDYIDVHWYWKWGEASWDEWIAKSPMEMENEWYDGGTIPDEIASFASLTSNLGHPHIKLASLEWNIGPGPWTEDPNHSKFRTALMQSEMQMQMMQGGLEIGSLWAAHWPGTEDASDRFLVDPDEDHTANPIAEVYKLFKNALRGQVLASSSSDSKAQVMAVVNDENTMYVYILNKNSAHSSMNVTLEGYEFNFVQQSLCFKDPGVVDNIFHVRNGSTISMVLPGYSITMLELSTAAGAASGLNSQEDLLIWPNPASDQILMETKYLRGEADYQLCNNLGIPLRSGRIVLPANKTVSLKVHDLLPGSYIMILSDKGGQRLAQKFMVSR